MTCRCSTLVGFGSFIQALILPVLGVLAVTSEWSQRTGLVTFTLEPSRGRSLAAKVSAVIILGLAAIAILLAFAAAFTVLLEPCSPRPAPGTSAGTLCAARRPADDVSAFGLALGMILLNSAATIVISFMLPTIFSILVNVISWLRDAAPWLDKNTALQDFLVDGATVNGTDGRRRVVALVDLDPHARRHLSGDEERSEVVPSEPAGVERSSRLRLTLQDADER